MTLTITEAMPELIVTALAMAVGLVWIWRSYFSFHAKVSRRAKKYCSAEQEREYHRYCDEAARLARESSSRAMPMPEQHVAMAKHCLNSATMLLAEADRHLLQAEGTWPLEAATPSPASDQATTDCPSSAAEREPTTAPTRLSLPSDQPTTDIGRVARTSTSADRQDSAST